MLYYLFCLLAARLLEQLVLHGNDPVKVMDEVEPQLPDDMKDTVSKVKDALDTEHFDAVKQFGSTCCEWTNNH